jgi:hypothetical protein
MSKAAARLLAARRAASNVDILDRSFPQQCGFIEDPAKLKALFCTRRAAKSYTGGLYLIRECLATPKVNTLFIGLTRESAKGIVWKDILKAINSKYRLGMRFNESSLTVTFPNGSIIRVTGADADEDEMNKLLGKKYKLAILDEASMYTINLRNLVYGVLKPAVADQRGTICMLGTASNFPAGLFFDITTGNEKGWSLHTWSAYENPHIVKQWTEEVAEIAEHRPLFMQTSLYKQWYLNEWVIDTDKLVYKYSGERNSFMQLPMRPPGGWTYVLGVDTGWEDDNAFVLIGYHEHDKVMYVVRTYNQPHMTFDQVVGKIDEFMKHPTMAPSKIIIDGANKQGVESMKQRSAIPFEYADKQGKVDFIEMLNADLVQGLIKINNACSALVGELSTLVWKTDGEKIVYPKKEHPGLSNHLCDAFLYAWRNGYHYQSSIPEVKPIVGTAAWHKAMNDDIWTRERERLEAEANLDSGSWPSGGEWGNL